MADYKVVSILDKYSLIINYGEKDGAKLGKGVRIYEKGSPIYDGDIYLGNLDIIKDDLEIIRTYEKFSICRHIEKVNKNPFTGFRFERITEEVRELNVDEKDFNKLKYETKDPIRVGDLVKIL